MKRRFRAEFCAIILVALCGRWLSPAYGAVVTPHRVMATTRAGMEVDVYRVGPVSAAVGILLSSSQRGLTPGIKRWATQLGLAGYRVLVIDLYGGRVYQSPAHAQAAFDAIKPQVLAAQVRVGLRLLRAPGRKLVSMGWGRFGGARALAAALTDSGLIGGVVLYNDEHHLPSASWKLRELKAPVLGLYFRDQQANGRIQSFADAMRRAHKTFYVHYYPGSVTRALFTGPEAARGDAVRAAWTETEGFLADTQHDCRRCAGQTRPRPRYHRYYHHPRR